MTGRLMRAMLRLYPEPFRRRFGRELLQIWQLESTEAKDSGRLASSRWWLGWLAATLVDALRQRLRRDPSLPVFPASQETLNMDSLRSDFSFAFRTLRRRPGWTWTVACTLALGLGATTAIFSIVNDTLLRPLPYEDSDRLVVVDPVTPKSQRAILACFPAYETFRDAQRGLERLETWSTELANVDLGGGPTRRTKAMTSAGLLQTLRLEPMLGRGFTDRDDQLGSEPVVMVSHRLWQSELGGSAAVLGQKITVDEVGHTVVGVLPAGLTFPDAEADFWLPLGGAARGPNYYYLSMLGRLEDGVSVEQLQARFASLELTMPNGNEISPIDLAATPMQESMVGDLRPQLTLFLAAVATVLLIACLNAAHLILTRAVGRRRELALRAALGAGRGQLIRQLVVEGAALGLLGGGLGALLAAAILEGLRGLGPEWMPRPEELGLDATALAFGFTLAIGVGALLGLLTALRAASRELASGISNSRGEIGGSGQHARALLIVAQLAGAVVLVGTAFLLVHSFQNIAQKESGFDTTGVMLIDIDLPEARYGQIEQQQAYFSRLLEELRSLPGVTAATAASSHPFIFYINQGFILDGYQPAVGENLAARIRLVADDYLATTGGRLLEGRFVAERDSDAITVNASLAGRFFPGGSAIGQRIRLNSDPENSWRTIVGVVADVEHYGRLDHWRAAIYEPASAAGSPHPMSVMLRTHADPLALADAVRQRARQIDPLVPISALTRLDEVLWQAKSAPRLRTTLLGAFGALALLLAVVGLYAVMAFWVAERRREMGVRLALGADRGRILRQVLGHGLRLVTVGIGIGLLLWWPAVRLVRHQLPDLTSPQPILQAAAIALLAITALLACWLPARRAAGVDPMTALRED